jgi:hypothetical protein
MSRLVRAALAAVLFTALRAPLLADEGANRLTDGETRAGWKLLFDGKSPTGWRGFKQDAFPVKGWAVEDGWLHVVAGGGGGDIVTTGEYGDFELSLEWKAGKGANSGIMVRVSEDTDTPWMSAPEFQVFDDADPHDIAKTSAGAMYDLYPPVKKSLKPAGEVNHARIVVAGNRIEHWLNGVLVVDAVLGSEDWKARLAASKFAEMPHFAKSERGRISLQEHGDDVWFRSIKIRELPAAEVALLGRERVDLFDGRTLEGWAHHLETPDAKREDTWRVEDGVLICSGSPAGYIRTIADYTNYHLVVEWRWPPGKEPGNSGVLLRQVGEDKVWPKSIEAQLYSGHAGDFWCIGGFPMTTDPARTNGGNTKHTKPNENAPGEWNRYDILVDGGTVELRVNGELLNNATGCEEVPGKICLQSEGAEIHFRTVRLYPLGKSAAKE